MNKRKKASTFSFEADRDYQGIYFLKIDAAGHSSIVAQNTADVVDRFFQAFEDSVRAEVHEAKKLNGCMYSQFWGWAGDGGLCVIYDDQEESRALKTAIEAGCNILTRRLRPLRQTLEKLERNPKRLNRGISYEYEALLSILAFLVLRRCRIRST